MGIIHHTVLVVTGCDYEFGPVKQRNLLTKSHEKALKFFGKKQVTKLTGSGMNGYLSFMVSPSGSNLGWEEAQEHEAAMEKMIEYLDSIRYEDGSTSIEYVKVSFGECGLQVSDWRGNDLDVKD